MFLKNAYNKLHKKRINKDMRLRESLSSRESLAFPFRLLDIQVFFLRVAESFFRFIIILIFPPNESFELLYKTKTVEHITVSYTKFKEIHAQVRVFSRAGGVVIVITSVLVGLFLNIITGVYKSAYAATFTWTQTAWNTVSTNTTGHPAPSNWTEFSATSTGITSGSDLSITRISTSTTQTVPYFSN